RGHAVGAIAVHLDAAVAHVLARFLQDMHDIHGAAAAHAKQDQFHGPEAVILAADVGAAVDDQPMAAVGGAGKLNPALPVDARFHGSECVRAHAFCPAAAGSPQVASNSASAVPGSGARMKDSPIRKAPISCSASWRMSAAL